MERNLDSIFDAGVIFDDDDPEVDARRREFAEEREQEREKQCAAAGGSSSSYAGLPRPDWDEETQWRLTRPLGEQHLPMPKPVVTKRRFVRGARGARGAKPPSTARVRRAIGGMHLPSQLKKIVDSCTPQDLIPQERPFYVSYGEEDCTADLEKELNTASAGIESPPPVPEYIQHFNGGGGWTAPVVDVDEETRVWRERQRKRPSNKTFRNERERLLHSFKRHRGDPMSAAEAEDDLFRRVHPDEESEDELADMRAAWHRVDAARRKKARLAAEAAAEAAAKAAAEAAAEAAAQAAAEAADAEAADELAAILTSSEEEEEEEEEPPEKGFTELSDEDTDLEDRIYPEPVPAFLLDRRSSYIKKSTLAKRQPPAPPETKKWWLELTAQREPPAARFDPEPESEDDDIEIVFAPPDAMDVGA